MSTMQRTNRREFVAKLLAATPDALVITGLGSAAYDVFAAGDRDRNYYLWGAMGGAAPMGLGLALAQPDKPVVVITGDGELLMGIGSLATIAVKQPKNLTIVVLDNGHFGETGMQRSHSSLGTDLVAVANGFGIATAFTAASPRAAATSRAASMRDKGLSSRRSSSKPTSRRVRCRRATGHSSRTASVRPWASCHSDSRS